MLKRSYLRIILDSLLFSSARLHDQQQQLGVIEKKLFASGNVHSLVVVD